MSGLHILERSQFCGDSKEAEMSWRQLEQGALGPSTLGILPPPPSSKGVSSYMNNTRLSNQTRTVVLYCALWLRRRRHAQTVTLIRAKSRRPNPCKYTLHVTSLSRTAMDEIRVTDQRGFLRMIFPTDSAWIVAGALPLSMQKPRSSLVLVWHEAMGEMSRRKQ